MSHEVNSEISSDISSELAYSPAPEPPVCDYSNYDYQYDFWQKTNRRYEDHCEKMTIRRLLATIPRPIRSLCDVGCGFGRLFPAYHDLAESFVLTDYAQSLLDQAASHIPSSAPVRFVQADIYSSPFESEQFDVCISIRTLHHLQPDLFFKELYRITAPNGYVLIEIPNQRHLVNRIKYRLGKLKQNPNHPTPIQLSNAFWNYHPAKIESLLKQNGFVIQKRVSTSFFRHPLFKRFFSVDFLVRADTLLQAVLSWTDVSPSILLLCKKSH